ncbi:Zn-dependent hydrolase of the beta-lactamase fold [Gloeomargarita lithophora Alchichica-D10]|uniref:Zn-dependent hydrolase of the beta-lactamase fold n=1 Tax=Gloeomargarita lithophora Alchichica-D10 TaxID=1188229 RepID=A0A1J0AH51_9CYAN|nr:MBL fold metallo-hydrolase [Gloeomargarita lithophora]APB35247.1 Zn-dependent hydrolase of the beta-lactamase fold [Gloeomargarita lithophora Alchichica-D10]
MQFTILSHAGLLVQDQGVSLVSDPWLRGSCYWRSWWNFPEAPPELIANLQPDYIYLTHLHWDHFHGPSLRHFDRETQMLVPLVHTRRMVKDLQDLGFRNIMEIPHGGKIKLGNNLFLYSFQFGITVDSAIVITNGETTLFNANDCKLFGLPLQQIKKRFPQIDFVFRSFSSASAIPYCIEDYQQRFGEFRSAAQYIQEFTEFSLTVGAKYAIPFASNHCFLHRETQEFNPTAVSPTAVAQYCNQTSQVRGSSSQCVLMPPGSSWSDTQGFNLREFDYQQADAYIAHLQEKYHLTLEKQYTKEAQVKPDYRAFERYFTALFRALPPGLPKISRMTVLFHIYQQDNNYHHYWLLDFHHRKTVTLTEPIEATLTIKIPALVINDCCRKRMFSTWGPSKRLRIRLGQGASWVEVRVFLSLLDAWENEYLPLWNHLRPRYLGIWLRRWREFVEAGRLVWRWRGRSLPVEELYRSRPPAPDILVTK